MESSTEFIPKLFISFKISYTFTYTNGTSSEVVNTSTTYQSFGLTTLNSLSDQYF
ncbi:hypothetical protein PIROE2DRAFT_10937 [Piromyces sp. E2]|nr:hypothetical protein PIROE2DRAFT_10937 [Piromyces sp. E2]|eukprot:OUM62728.1 hypothetical protein PIROE2DRAFT_10937 [Piromyces sp. E2]